jgi:hypothetical protein
LHPKRKAAKVNKRNPEMKRKSLIGATLALTCALMVACSPYHVHKNAPPRIAHKAYKPPMTILNFQARSGCGCH